MAINNPYKAYEQNTVNTSTPGELTLMLYNGCLKFINQAKKAIDNGDMEAKNTAIQKSQAIINELSVTLDRSFEVADNMLVLYEFVNNRLLEANMKNDTAKLDEASAIVADFRDTWKQVIQINRQKQYGTTGEV